MRFRLSHFKCQQPELGRRWAGAAQRRPLRRFLGAIVWWLRQVSGDAAYENYLRTAAGGGGAAYPHFGGASGSENEQDPAEARAGARADTGVVGQAGCGQGGGGVMTRDAFYLDSLRRRYSRASRCC